MKPVWKRSFDGMVFGDFFDGRGICRYEPNHAISDEHGWFPLDDAAPKYQNDQPTQNNPYSDNTSGVYVVWYAGKKWSSKLTQRQTELWNDYHNFTPYYPEKKEDHSLELDIKIIEKCIDEELVKYGNAIIELKKAKRIIENHDYVINRLRSELAFLERKQMDGDLV